MQFSPEEQHRYARHFILEEVGLAGQKKLKAASVLCIGAGGLGSPVALYLAAAGIGTIGIIDPDQVELSNLQRQILHGQSNVGQPKTDSAAARLAEINPHTKVVTYPTHFTAENAEEIARDYELVIDGTDNFTTRFLVNDLCFFLKKPNVYASILGFHGQFSVFAPHLGGPCYRCMLPEPPSPGAVPSCAEAGVLGVLPGILGSLQAMEAIKLILGIGTPPLGKLTQYDALSTSFRSIQLRRDPECPLCGDNPSIHQIQPTAFHCTNPQTTVTNISISDFKTLHDSQRDSFYLLDVRTPLEMQTAALDHDFHLPVQELASTFSSLPKDKPLYVLCKAGSRSRRACLFLEENGYENVTNILGGIDAWRKEFDPSLPFI